MEEQTLILGAGMTGLAAGIASGLPVIEAAASPGGICLSYRLRPGDEQPLPEDTAEDEVYRFENGGGHWIFGGDPAVLQFIRRLVPVQHYQRRSSVYFPDTGRYVPYPIQNHLRYLDKPVALGALEEMARPAPAGKTMADWVTGNFGETLAGLFFAPFHDLYTAGLYPEIAAQDSYKSPVDLGLALQGAFSDAPPVGYNTTFVYPQGGLNLLARRMAAQCNIDYGRRVTGLDTRARKLRFADGGERSYRRLLSTLPLNEAMDMAGLSVPARPDPHTSVLVVNIGAVRGEHCPDDHWLYIPFSDAGFHRVGFYSNVDRSFLPASARASGDRVSIYVERAFPAGGRPNDQAIARYCTAVVEELRRWGYIGTTEVVHPTWVEVAYTWSWPGSGWKQQAIRALEEVGIYQVGRYGRWVFQGIADSIRDGFIAGSAFRRYPGIEDWEIAE
jgi:protoporphyrinogen oxidase